MRIPTSYKRMASMLERFAYTLPLGPGFTTGRIEKAARMAKLIAQWDANLMRELVADRARRDPAVLGERVLTRQQQWRRALHGLRLVDLHEDTFT